MITLGIIPFIKSDKTIQNRGDRVLLFLMCLLLLSFGFDLLIRMVCSVAIASHCRRICVALESPFI